MSKKHICKYCGSEYVSEGKDSCATCEGQINDAFQGSLTDDTPHTVNVQYTKPSKESIDEISRILNGERWEDIVKSKKKWWQFWK